METRKNSSNEAGEPGWLQRRTPEVKHTHRLSPHQHVLQLEQLLKYWVMFQQAPHEHWDNEVVTGWKHVVEGGDCFRGGRGVVGVNVGAQLVVAMMEAK